MVSIYSISSLTLKSISNLMQFRFVSYNIKSSQILYSVSSLTSYVWNNTASLGVCVGMCVSCMCMCVGMCVSCMCVCVGMCLSCMCVCVGMCVSCMCVCGGMCLSCMCVCVWACVCPACAITHLTHLSVILHTLFATCLRYFPIQYGHLFRSVQTSGQWFILFKSCILFSTTN